MATITTLRGMQIEALAQAKRRATDEFSDGFIDHKIQIFEINEGAPPSLVSTRIIGDKKWMDANV